MSKKDSCNLCLMTTCYIRYIIEFNKPNFIFVIERLTCMMSCIVILISFISVCKVY